MANRYMYLLSAASVHYEMLQLTINVMEKHGNKASSHIMLMYCIPKLNVL